MCRLCGNPDCQGDVVLVEKLIGMKNSELTRVISGALMELRKQLPKDQPVTKTALILESLVTELMTRFAELAVREAFSGNQSDSRRPDLLSMVLGARRDLTGLVGGALGGAGGAAYQRDVTPRRSARAKGPGGKVQRRFGPPKRKDS